MKVTLVDEVGIRIAERLGDELDKTDEHGFALNTEFHQGVKDGLRIALQIMQDAGCSTASYTYMASARTRVKGGAFDSVANLKQAIRDGIAAS